MRNSKARVGPPTLPSLSNSNCYDADRSEVTIPQETHRFDGLPQVNLLSGREEKVVLHGYLGARHDLSKNLSFVPVMDNKLHQIQIVSLHNSENSWSAHEKLRSIRPNTPVAVRGLLRPRLAAKVQNQDQENQVERPEKQRKRQGEVNAESANPENWAESLAKALKGLEIVLQDIQSLNDFPSDIVMTPDTKFPPEQRHLQFIVEGNLVQALDTRNSVARIIRGMLNKRSGFLEVETPLLFKSTSEGAREFVVPTRKKSMAYALPQSPQQFKQILMASRINNYYQFAKCFRDEDLRADRQPEFTQVRRLDSKLTICVVLNGVAQLDIEMSFANGNDVIDAVEKVILQVWRQSLGTKLLSTFPRITYDQAMSRYGSDKPDLRIPISPFARIDVLLPADLISKITPLKDPLVEAMIVPLDASPDGARAFITGLLELTENKHLLDNPDGGPGIFIYDSSKPLQGLSAFGFEAVEQIENGLDLQDGCLIVLQARKKAPLSGGLTPLGNLRTSIHNAAVDQGYLPPVDWEDFRPLWVTDFPLFKPPDNSEPGQGGNAGLASTHHPFTSPKTPEDVDLLLTDPTKAIGDHYDLVINGEEIGGGSRRVHHAAMQEFIFRDILKMDDERIAEFSHLLEALRAGCPPHAGIALGFDRLVAMIQSSKDKKKRSLRDVIAFPKSGKGEDLMMRSPGSMSEETLKTYHLKLRD